MYIFLILSTCIIFSTLAMNTIKIEKLKKKVNNNFLVPVSVLFLTKNCLLSFFYKWFL